MPDYDIFVIDMTTAPPIEPDVSIIPICDRASNENAAALDEKLLVTGALGLALAAAFWPRGRR